MERLGQLIRQLRKAPISETLEEQTSKTPKEQLYEVWEEQISEALEELKLSIPIKYLLDLHFKPQSLTKHDHRAARAAILCRLERRSEGPDYRIKVPKEWRFLVSDSEEIVISKYSFEIWEEKAREFLKKTS